MQETFIFLRTLQTRWPSYPGRSHGLTIAKDGRLCVTLALDLLYSFCVDVSDLTKPPGLIIDEIAALLEVARKNTNRPEPSDEPGKLSPYEVYLYGVVARKSFDAAKCFDGLKDMGTRYGLALAIDSEVMNRDTFIERCAKALNSEGVIWFNGKPLLAILANVPASILRDKFNKWLAIFHRNAAPAVSVEDIVDKLNALLELDRPGVSKLLMSRFPVNAAVADSEHTIATPEGEVGTLGLLNGLLPRRANGFGQIVAEVEEETYLVLRVYLGDEGTAVQSPVPASAESTHNESTHNESAKSAFAEHANTCSFMCGTDYAPGRCAEGDRLAALAEAKPLITSDIFIQPTEPTS